MGMLYLGTLLYITTGITGGLLRVSVGITGTKEQRWAQLEEAVRHVLHGPFRPISAPGVNATLTIGGFVGKSPGKTAKRAHTMAAEGESEDAPNEEEGGGKRVCV